VSDSLPQSPEKVSFEIPPELYEKLIDWEKRLAHEAPFYRWLFDRFAVQRVLDVACGTGHHAALFHSWGLVVEGADASPAMIAFAKTRFGEPPGLTWLVRNFLSRHPQSESFDAVVCLGNSLSLARDSIQVAEAVQNMYAAVRKGGCLLIHFLNFARVPDRSTTWQKVGTVLWDGRTCLVLKGLHRLGQEALVTFVVVDPHRPAIVQSLTEKMLCTALESTVKTASCLKVAPSAIELFMDYRPGEKLALPGPSGEHLERAQDLLLVIRKDGTASTAFRQDSAAIR
jgi:SAM-dependent methyltransferase